MLLINTKLTSFIERRNEVRFMQFKDVMKNPEMGKQRYTAEDKYLDTRNRQKTGVSITSINGLSLLKILTTFPQPECNVCGCGPVTNNAYRSKPIHEPDRFDVFGLLKCSLCDRYYHVWCLDTFFFEAHSWRLDEGPNDLDWTCPRHRIPDPNEAKHLPAYKRLEELVQPTAPLTDPSVVSNYILLDSYLPYFLNFTPFTIPVKRLVSDSNKTTQQVKIYLQLTAKGRKTVLSKASRRAIDIRSKQNSSRTHVLYACS